jgi:hypothetical protein
MTKQEQQLGYVSVLQLVEFAEALGFDPRTAVQLRRQHEARRLISDLEWRSGRFAGPAWLA